MSKINRIILVVLAVSIMLQGCFAYADDNATSGDGDTNDAVKNKAYYNYREYMYKVSVHVGLSDKVGTGDNLSSDFKMIGKEPIYVKPSKIKIPSGITYGNHNKVAYLAGEDFEPDKSQLVISDNPPPIPITSGGNVGTVKSYFGDTKTLLGLIDGFAVQKGTTREGLVSSIQFTINGEKKLLPPSEVLPIKKSGKYMNKVPWVIVYEPVIISYLKDKKTKLAFTATEYALAQKLGYFDFKYGKDGQQIGTMTHANLPNSIVLEKSWFGYSAIGALKSGKYWSDERIIKAGGWGMRMLKANGSNSVESDTSIDYEYRTNTEVISSVWVKALGNRIAHDDKAYITFNANGQLSTTEIVMPKNGEELAFIKWRTPASPGKVVISVSLTGNSAAQIEGKGRSATINANIVDLNENEPPNPTANDAKPSDFQVTSPPVKAQQTSAAWGVWKCTWKPDWQWESDWEWQTNWVWRSNWQWVSNWQWISYWVYNAATKQMIDCGWWVNLGYWMDYGQWVDLGYWKDNGKWVDKGDWEYEWISYSATLNANSSLRPDSKSPSPSNVKMKSGYGINQTVSANIVSNAPSSNITGAQNAVSYYPEFEYKDYCRLLDLTTYGFNTSFELKRNKYSTYMNRVHFTPIWYPDGPYRTFTEVIDAWTPAGMLSASFTNSIDIQGSLYSDWHIGPKK